MTGNLDSLPFGTSVTHLESYPFVRQRVSESGANRYLSTSSGVNILLRYGLSEQPIILMSMIKILVTKPNNIAMVLAVDFILLCHKLCLLRCFFLMMLLLAKYYLGSNWRLLIPSSDAPPSTSM